MVISLCAPAFIVSISELTDLILKLFDSNVFTLLAILLISVPLILTGLPAKYNGENIDNKYANYIYISCTGGENSSNCVEAIKNKYNSLSGGTYVGEISAGHKTGILIYKADGKYGTIVKFTYPGSANSKAEMVSISICNGTWGGWVSLH